MPVCGELAGHLATYLSCCSPIVHCNKFDGIQNLFFQLRQSMICHSGLDSEAIWELVELGKLDANMAGSILSVCCASANTIGAQKLFQLSCLIPPPPNPPLCWSNIQVGRKMGSGV